MLITKQYLVLFFFLWLGHFSKAQGIYCKEINDSTAMMHADAEQRSVDSLSPLFTIRFDEKDDLIVIQWKGINREDRMVNLLDDSSNVVQQTTLYTGSTLAYLDTQLLYQGQYTVKINTGQGCFRKKIQINK